MQEPRVDLFTQLQKNVYEPAKKAYVKLEEQWLTLGRHVTVWSEANLRAPWSQVASKIFYSLPVASAIFLFPLSMNIMLGIGFYVADLGWGPFSQTTYDALFTGAFIGAATKAAVNTLGFVTTARPGYALDGLIYGLVSSVIFPHSPISKLLAERS